MAQMTAAEIFFADRIGRGSILMKNTQGRTKTSIVDAVAPAQQKLSATLCALTYGVHIRVLVTQGTMLFLRNRTNVLSSHNSTLCFDTQH